VGTEREVAAADGRTLHAVDGGSADPDALAVVWLGGSPQTGALLQPVVAAAEARGIRLVSYARPSYGGSTPAPGRVVASAAGDVAAVADAFSLDRFAVVGYSGGGPHALACAALLPSRVIGAVTLAGVAPYTDDVDWFAGMAAPGGLRAARAGRAARARYAETDAFDESTFTDTDWAALAGTWSALGDDANLAGAAGPDGLIDDDVAFAQPWNVDLGAVQVPVLLVQGGRDRIVPRSHAELLLGLLPTAELWLRPRDGHVAVLGGLPVAFDWLRALPAAGRHRHPANGTTLGG
jgi:pimeloyl-ACP methyl ester carboxylesterase